ncbi:MAG: hypothetical protein R2799_06650 [Crocinitomicaceae bacterium]
MKMKFAFLVFLAFGFGTIVTAQDKSKLEKACLDLFKNVSLPVEFTNSDNGIQSPEQNALTSEMQEKILSMGGFDDEGFGMHIGAAGKVELSKGIYLLMYSTLVVPVPSHMDEYSFAIYKEGSYKLENITDLAYTRGGAGMDEGVLTVKITKNGSSLDLAFKLDSKKSIETDYGLDYGPQETYSWTHSVDSTGKLKLGKKTKLK